ncbi:hypothetical protein CTAYLR_002293 [Chrysophaeum taylorii]|uniref:Uncharacterized protein n=1 Tax=Chrysophaeum taylorii TaxID=2483200 RepID=A0AAD7UNI9_9STRA|nr:hypothetical protein CTAYLR_002293 [Chrysophaeum taylorii]
MGKRKKKGDSATAFPVFHIKKQRLNQETNLTALVALHKYAHKFKLGAPGFREKGSNPFVITVVLNGSELGTAQHGEKEAAMEKACLITLHLLDPDGKSIVANIHHPNEAELKKLCLQITNAKQDEIRALAQSAAAAPLPTTASPPFSGGVPPFAAAFPGMTPMMFPAPQYPGGSAGMAASPAAVWGAAPVGPFGGGGGGTFPMPLPVARGPQSSVPPPTPQVTSEVVAPTGGHQHATATPAPLPPLTLATRSSSEAGFKSGGGGDDKLVWTNDDVSPEEARAALPKYRGIEPSRPAAAPVDDTPTDESIEALLEEVAARHRASSSQLVSMPAPT